MENQLMKILWWWDTQIFQWIFEEEDLSKIKIKSANLVMKSDMME